MTPIPVVQDSLNSLLRTVVEHHFDSFVNIVETLIPLLSAARDTIHIKKILLTAPFSLTLELLYLPPRQILGSIVIFEALFMFEYNRGAFSDFFT
jgi:hypothetical protein